MRDFRNSSPSSCEWLDVRKENGFSNFRFVDNRFRSCPTLRRILSLARKHGFKSILVERIRENECELLAQENQALAVRCPKFSGSTAHRLLFLDGEKDGDPGRLLGYAVFKQDEFTGRAPATHVYECVMPPVRDTAQNNFIHSPVVYRINSSQGTLETRGILYAQQNDLTFVCAHVALRTALSCLLPDGDVTYDTINRILGIDHTTRRVGDGKGLSPSEMEKVVTSLGLSFSKIAHEPNPSGGAEPLVFDGEFQRELYGNIESGFPALLGFELNSGGRHIIPVFGHTFNDDTWVADSGRSYFAAGLGYFSSENRLSAFTVHDDNFGPYLCIPRYYLKQENFRILLGLRPHVSACEAAEIEAAALVYANTLTDIFMSKGTMWQRRLALFAKEGLLVLRTLLVEKPDYLRHLESDHPWNGDTMNHDTLEALKADLPDRFWMVELSAPELFPASRHKFGEILLRADLEPRDPLDLSLLSACRFPGMVIMRNRADTLAFFDSGIQSHVPLYHMDSLYKHPTRALS